MNPTKIRCPHCGSEILIRGAGKISCPHCRADFFVEERAKDIRINMTVNRYEGGGKPASSHFLLYPLLGVLVILSLLGSRVFRRSPKAEPLKESFQEKVESPFLRRLCAEIFQKDPDLLTAEEYGRVEKLCFLSSDEIDAANGETVFHIDVGLSGEEERDYIVVLDGEGSDLEIPISDFQPFSSLKTLNVNPNFGLRITQETGEYSNSLRNLTKLQDFTLSSWSYEITDWKDFFASPKELKALRGASIWQLDEIVDSFPNLETLEFNPGSFSSYQYQEKAPDLKRLSELSSLHRLSTDLLKDNDYLLSIANLQELALNGGEESGTDYSILYHLPHLKELIIYSGKGFKDLSFLSAMPELSKLSIEGSELRDLSPLAGNTVLQELYLSRDGSIADLSVLGTLTGLKRLSLSDTGGGEPDLSALSSLVRMEIDQSFLPSAVSAPALSDLTLIGGGDGDLEILSGKTSLEKLCIRGGGSAEASRELCESLSGLKELSVKGSYISFEGITLDHWLCAPALQKLIVYGSYDIYWTDGFLPDNSTLRELSLIGAPKLIVRDAQGMRIEGGETELQSILPALSSLHGLKRLQMVKEGISDLEPLRALSELETLDISENYVRDLLPLRDLPALKMLDASGNPIQNRSALSGDLYILS